MAINRFNTGRDISIDFNTPSAIGPNGAIIAGGLRRFSGVVGFTSRQNTRKESSHGIDGISRFQYIPQGWEGTITIDRFDRLLDDTINEFENLYLEGGHVPGCWINETIREPDGTVSQWRYENVVFSLPDAGAKEQDKKIAMRLEWSASFRKKIQ